jgi:NAD(P)-dependent dehydrogenase (short-subunit alcohol dehydrogenase family)
MNDSNTSLVWFITGCSSGFGRALAERVLQRGHRCVVTARDLTRIDDIVAPYAGRSLALALDVRDDAQRREALASARKAFGRIDVLVNNAGHGYSAAVEEGDEPQIRAMFDTNFFALAAMTRLVLPQMREQRSGTIVNISSVGGLVANPASGYYAATKFAVEGLSEALAKEVAPLGIRVALIEPGPFRTDFQGRSMTSPTHEVADYAETAGARRAQLLANSGKQPGDPVRAAEIIVDLVESGDPPLHLVLGKPGFERVREKLQSLLESLDRSKTISLSSDFP